MMEHRSDKSAYAAPELAEVGGFAELTQGWAGWLWDGFLGLFFI